MKNTQKGFIGIGAIIAIVAVLGIGAVATYVVKKSSINNQKVEPVKEVGSGQASGITATSATSAESDITIDEGGVHVTSTNTAANSGGQASITPPTDIFANADGGYSFSVPDKWKVGVNVHNNKNSLFGPDGNTTTGLGGVEVFNQWTSLNAFLEAGDVQYTSKMSVTVDGTSGVRAKYIGTSGKGEQVVFVKDGKIYNIYVNSENDADIQAFDQIVLSFKFN